MQKMETGEVSVRCNNLGYIYILTPASFAWSKIQKTFTGSSKSFKKNKTQLHRFLWELGGIYQSLCIAKYNGMDVFSELLALVPICCVILFAAFASMHYYIWLELCEMNAKTISFYQPKTNQKWRRDSSHKAEIRKLSGATLCTFGSDHLCLVVKKEALLHPKSWSNQNEAPMLPIWFWAPSSVLGPNNVVCRIRKHAHFVEWKIANSNWSLCHNNPDINIFPTTW